MISDVNIVLDKYKIDGIILDIRSDKVLAYKDGEFLLDAHKMGDFWYVNVDKGVL